MHQGRVYQQIVQGEVTTVLVEETGMVGYMWGHFVEVLSGKDEGKRMLLPFTERLDWVEVREVRA